MSSHGLSLICTFVSDVIITASVAGVTAATPRYILRDIPKPMGIISPAVRTLSSRVCFNHESTP